jgi:malto-oligosyltrehalose synthase
MYKPDVTYRIQFHKDFNLTQFEAIIPYLHRLGIKTIYASPIFAAMPGSNHGYDGIDPNLINPEIGSWEQFVSISRNLKELGMGWLQDFVPNHMAFSPLNPWIYDVLEKGIYSEFDDFFDKQSGTPLMVPVLSSPLEEALNNKEITLAITGSKLQLRHGDLDYPLNAHAYRLFLNETPLDGPIRILHQHALEVTLPHDRSEYESQWQHLLTGFSKMLNEQVSTAILQQQLVRFNDDPNLMKRILDLQFYRLCDWRETAIRINYRRFFTVNGLICLNMQDPDVFDRYHRLLLKMVQEDLIQGIRIDHIDGLSDPEEYLMRLRQYTGPDTYICVEKILGYQEKIPLHWPVQGTTGYDFMNEVAQLMTNTAAQQIFNSHYRKLSQEDTPVPELIDQYKSRLLAAGFQGDLDNLTALFLDLPGLSVPEEIRPADIREVIARLLIHCPVYRFYPRQIPLSGDDLYDFTHLLMRISEGDQVPVQALDFVRSCFLTKAGQGSADYDAGLLYFWRRCMQFSGPLMAKGVEDTFSYNYFPLLAHSEVGSIPGSFGMSVPAFHDAMQERSQLQPLTMNASGTHDTKRGEDTRARLLQLSKEPETWFRQVRECLMYAQDGSVPAANEQYFILQVLYGALPFENKQEDAATWNQRIGEYLQKAAREAKRYSGWEQPDIAYESMLINYAGAITDKKMLRRR